MEVLVAVDKKMKEYHGDNLNAYVLTLMSIVSKICLIKQLELRDEWVCPISATMTYYWCKFYLTIKDIVDGKWLILF